MRRTNLMFGMAIAAAASPVAAADKLQFGPPPAWVKPIPIPETPPASADSGPVTIILADQQLDIGPGKTNHYNVLAVRLDTPQGLAAGNISLPWNPDADTVTVHRLVIHRGGTQIDVLKSQTFSMLRRETNLEAAMLDGMLTANIQPEGLQVGDIVEIALTTEHRDPVMKDHVEATVGDFNAANLSKGHVRVQWPDSIPLKAKTTAGLPPFRIAKVGNKREIEFFVANLQPLSPPKLAPPRFSIGRALELTDFGSWSDLAHLMRPYYDTASMIPATGPLRDEVEKIRNSTTSETDRTEAALSLVQDRIRYVALFMGQGGYMPTTAQETWSRRFGDCKAKTALLLGILRELKIDAIPVLVNGNGGDGLDSRVPSAGVFNHVLVLARVGGKDYWLDGTRSGDGRLQNISVPMFRWGLPLAQNAKLVPIMPAVPDRPTAEVAIRIDAREGIRLPAPTKVEIVFRGSDAVDLNSLLNSIPPAQRSEALRTLFKQKVEDLDVTSSNSSFDATSGELRLRAEGTAKIDWDDNYYYSRTSRLGYDPDFKRPPGPFADAPFATNYPEYSKETETILLPAGFVSKAAPIKELNLTVAGVEYRRKASFADDIFSVESTARAVLPEVPFQAALADQTQLEELADNWLSIRIPNNYRETPKELAQLVAEKLTKPGDLNRRGYKLLDAWKFDEAIADFTASLAIEPNNSAALASRGIAYVWKDENEKARRDLEAAEKADPKQPIVFRAKGLMAERAGNWNEAIAAYTTALKLEPGNSFSLGHRAEAYRALGQDELALADTAAALDINPKWHELRILRANIFFSQAKNELAAKVAEELSKSDSNNSFNFVAAARIYAKLGRNSEAMNAFDQAIARKPEAYIYINRAQSRPLSDFAGRLADLDEALKLEPDNAAAIAEKAEQLAVAGNIKGALSLYDRVAKIEPNNSYLGMRRAIILYKNGSTAEAERILSERRKEAKTAIDFNNLCWAKATAGILLESALQDCQEALKLQPERGSTIDSMAFVKLRTGRFDEAIALYDQAITKKTGSASYMGRAIAYARKGDRTHAEADRAEAMKLDPDADTRFAEYGLKF